MISPQLTAQCHCKKTAPCGMYRGSATTDHQFSYFTPFNSNSVYSCQWSTEKLPPCPYYNSGLVIINGQLTAVGGEDGSYRCTNKLFTFRQSQWIGIPSNEHSTFLYYCSYEYIIVIGGHDCSWTATVELFQVSSRRWHQLKDV